MRGQTHNTIMAEGVSPRFGKAGKTAWRSPGRGSLNRGKKCGGVVEGVRGQGWEVLHSLAPGVAFTIAVDSADHAAFLAAQLRRPAGKDSSRAGEQRLESRAWHRQQCDVCLFGGPSFCLQHCASGRGVCPGSRASLGLPCRGYEQWQHSPLWRSFGSSQLDAAPGQQDQAPGLQEWEPTARCDWCVERRDHGGHCAPLTPVFSVPARHSQTIVTTCPSLICRAMILK